MAGRIIVPPGYEKSQKQKDPKKEFGSKPPMTGADIIGNLVKRLKNDDFYTRKYAALDLRDIAKEGGDIEPARHILIEIVDGDYRPDCKDAALEAIVAADKVNDKKYEEYLAKKGKR